MGAKYIMQYIARVSGGGPNVQVKCLQCLYLPPENDYTKSQLHTLYM